VNKLFILKLIFNTIYNFICTLEFEVKIFAHVSGFEYPLSLLPVCYHGTGRIILASTVTSRAQACQITVTGGLPLHLAISSSRKHLIFSQHTGKRDNGYSKPDT
jgi:hypothetical protein